LRAYEFVDETIFKKRFGSEEFYQEYKNYAEALKPYVNDTSTIMNYAIDKSKKVVEVKYRVKPFVLTVKPSVPVKYVLELPEGTGSLFKLGETLKF